MQLPEGSAGFFKEKTPYFSARFLFVQNPQVQGLTQNKQTPQSSQEKRPFS